MSDYYQVTNAELIEGFDPDPHGNLWYNVKLAEEAETIMWLAKNAPEEGKKYYGRLEPTKSGKRLRFRREQEPDGQQTLPVGKKESKVADYEPSTNARWAIGMAYRAFIQVTGTPEDSNGDFPFEAVKTHARKLVEMFDEIKNSGSPSESKPTLAPKVIKEAEQPAADLKDKVKRWQNKPQELDPEEANTALEGMDG